MSGRDKRTNRNHYKRVSIQGSVKIDPADFREVMNDLLEQYGAGVVDVAIESADVVSQQAKDDLKSGIGGYKNRTGKYRLGWRARLEVENTKVEAVTYNWTAWQLTHLLEFGHQLKRGGRKVGDAQAYPHLASINEWAVREFERLIKQGVEAL